MGPTTAIFHALQTFDRLATRREIEREAGLEKEAVDGALRVLARAGALVAIIERPKTRGLYALVPGAVCPPERGRYKR